ncbi:PilZ domain-containing protein [Paenibacillus pinistramenti]|uniref:PilZ domain-containing protein n=1 Tax=Paenibacillus pinistramenti TaxID=1768003 RepID=UPI001108D0B4|nr:PilZ domain-containing protein [Paenibacillus pinistramenti]
MEDKRKFERTKLPPMEMVVNRLTSGQRDYSGVSMILEDISEAGMRIITDLDLKPGDLIQLDLPELSEDQLIQGRVSWTMKLENGRYRCGLQFFAESEQGNEYF